MSYNILMNHNYFILLSFPFAAFILNLILTPLLIKLADFKGYHDEPDARKIHKTPVSNIGGIGFTISSLIMISLMSFFFEIPLNYIFIISGFVLIHIVGILDDRKDIRARYKLIFQIVAALIVVMGGVAIKSIEIPFTDYSFSFGPISVVITIFWIVSVSNSVNLIDGLDGQAGGLSFIALIAIGISHLLNGNLIPAMISFVIAASVGAFLVFNFPPAKIFMGDGGSLLLGFAIAVLPLLNAGGSIVPLMGPLTIIMIPVLDVIASIVRRKRKGLHFFTPDKEHTHHKLLDFGFTNKQILALIYSLTILFALISIYWSVEPDLLAFLLILSAWLSGGIIFLILDVKYENKVRAKRREENIRLIS